jgi:hypothetical protein
MVDKAQEEKDQTELQTLAQAVVVELYQNNQRIGEMVEMEVQE